MSRSLAVIALSLSLTLLVSCSLVPEKEAPPTPQNDMAVTALQEWLVLEQSVASLSHEEVIAELTAAESARTPNELFYQGLLNQHMQTFSAWTEARDTFRALQVDENTSAEQRQLAGILEIYNQNRINWYQRQSELVIKYEDLKQELAIEREEKLLLEQKIQALTDLEAVISTRKE